MLVGAPKRRGIRALLRRSTATELAAARARLRRRHDRGRPTGATPTGRGEPTRGTVAEPTQPPRRKRYAWAAGISIACTALAWMMLLLYPPFEAANIVMVYLLGTTIAGLRLGRRPSVLTTLLNVLFFDFFFVPPRFTFAVSDAQYVDHVRRHAHDRARDRAR